MSETFKSFRRAPKIKKVLRRELVVEYRRIEKELRLRQMDFDAVDAELRLLLVHGYLPRIGEPEVWIDDKGRIRIDDEPQ
jgi:hypothetical protein